MLHLVSLSASPSEELFMYLVERGADPNGEDEKLGTPLILALQQGHEDFARWMIEKYKLRCDIQGKSLEKTSTLHKASGFCSPKMVSFLMDSCNCGVLLHTLDAQNYSPLMIAVKEKRADNAELLLKKYQANPNQAADTSALFIAVQDGYVPTTRVLLENGADASLWHAGMEVTPLHIAASNDHVYVVQELVKHGAKLDATSGKGYTPLIMACSQGYTETPRILAEAGASLNYQCPMDGATALHHAATGGFVACAKTLLAAGASPDVKDAGDMTPADCVEHFLKERPNDKALLLLKNIFATASLAAKDKCASCYAKLDQPKRCGKCKEVRYCSVACQTAHWKAGHSKECKPKP